MSEKFKINLMIAGKNYPLTIEREQEEKYRRAEREVNSLVATYRTKFRAEPEDYLAMAALQLSVSNVAVEMSQTVNDDSEINILKEVDAKLDRYFTGEKK